MSRWAASDHRTSGEWKKEIRLKEMERGDPEEGDLEGVRDT